VSLILDALNRSRHDADPVPGLASSHGDPESGSDRPAWRPVFPWLALGVALIAVGWLLLERGEQGAAQAPTATVPAEPAPAAVAAPDAERTVPAVTASGEPPAPEPAGQASGPPPGAPVEAPAEAAAGAADPAVTALYQREDAGPSIIETRGRDEPAGREADEESGALQKSTSEEPVDIEALVSRARDQVENARLVEHPAPFIAQLSQQTKDRIPTIYYTLHDYGGDSSSSSVVLNGTKLSAGDRTSKGVRVEEILPDSVVLSYEGTQFRLRALNSWINL